MASGDIGGPVTELIVTCKTIPDGPVAIKRGDALVLHGNYVVGHATEFGQAVIGQAMNDCDRNSAAIHVRLRGICPFPYAGTAPVIRGIVSVVTGREPGSVAIVPGGYEGRQRGVVMKINSETRIVDVLL